MEIEPQRFSRWELLARTPVLLEQRFGYHPQEATRGHRGLQGVTGGNKGLQRVTREYRVAGAAA